MRKIDELNAEQLCSYLETAEVDPDQPTDTRRIVSDERQRLTAAMQAGDPAHIDEALREARRVAKMWLDR